MRIAVIGGPSAGKSTFAGKLSGYLNIPRFSIGDELRKAKINIEKLKRGALVDDDEVRKIVQTFTAANPNRWVIDGFPRYSTQAIWLDNLLKERFYMVVMIGTCLITIKKRLRTARICPACGNIVWHTICPCGAIKIPEANSDNVIKIWQKKYNIWLRSERELDTHYTSGGSCSRITRLANSSFTLQTVEILRADYATVGKGYRYE